MYFLNRLLVTLIVAVCIVLLIGAFMPELRKEKEQAARVDDLKKQVDEQKMLLAQREREVDLLKNDRGYVEMLARDRLDLMKDGETILRIETPQAAAPAARSKTRTQ